jgi:protein-disulfide isomerase
MSSDSARPLRRERRAAALAQKRTASRRAAPQSRRIGLGTVTVAALGAGALLVAVLLILGAQSKPAPASVFAAAAPAGRPAEGYVLGNAAAPVTIDLYEDFQCPACERWGQNVFPSVARNEIAAGTARLVFHSYAFIGPESEGAARASWAAAAQGRFWDMWATLYANQGLRENGGAYTRERLVLMADAIHLDAARFAVDLDSPAAAKWVADSSAESAAAGINSTPSLKIDGVLFTGSTYPELSAAIADAAAR